VPAQDLRSERAAAQEGTAFERDERDLLLHPRLAHLFHHVRLDAALGVVGDRFRLDLDHGLGALAQEAEHFAESGDALAAVSGAEAAGIAPRRSA